MKIEPAALLNLFSGIPYKAVFPLEKFSAIMPVTVTRDLLALASLGDVTQIEMIQSVLCRPRRPRQVHSLLPLLTVLPKILC